MISWYILLIISLLFTLFVLIQEWKRKSKRLLFIRSLATTAAFGTLVTLAYPFPVPKNFSGPGNIGLVTSGYIKDSLLAFRRPGKTNEFLFSTDPELSIGSAIPIKWIQHVGTLLEKFTDDTVHVFGNGYNAEELVSLQGHPVVYHAGKSVSGFSSVFWQQQLTTGEPLIVQGRCRNETDLPAKLLLSAFGETVDTANIPARSNKDFSLQTIPKNHGRAVYTLLCLGKKDTIETERLPFEVTAAKPMQILFLTAAPAFENTFLKNRLAQHGYAVSMRTTISKNKSDRQFLNTDTKGGNLLTKANLETADLVIADREALAASAPATIEILRTEIAENGLGLLVKMDGPSEGISFYNAPFPVFELPHEKKGFAGIHLSSNDSVSIKLKDDFLSGIRDQAGNQVLLRDDHQNIVGSGTLYGKGKISATTITNSFGLALSGNDSGYQLIWTYLIEKTARKQKRENSWQMDPGFAGQDLPLTIHLESQGPGNPQGLANGETIYFAQDSVLPWRWRGIYWPQKTGWQILKDLAGHERWIYIYKEGDWKNPDAIRKMEATTAFAAKTAVKRLPLLPSQSNHGFLMAGLVIVFFISITFLWIEQKTK